RFAGLSLAMEQIYDTRRKPCFYEQLNQSLADGRRVFRWLENGCVALHQTRSKHPQRHGEWEIPGGDDRDHTPRFAAYIGILFHDFRSDNAADRHAARSENVLDHVQALDHFGPALRDHLAALPSHELGQGVGFSLNDLSQIIEKLSPMDSA